MISLGSLLPSPHSPLSSPRIPRSMKNTVLRATLCVALTGGFLADSAAATAADGKLAIRAGKIITMDGPVIEDGVIVIEDGRIAAVGADVEVPWDVPVLDASDLVAFPGFVEAHTSSGMDRPNENIDVAPFLSIRDSLDPVNAYFENAKRWGITAMNVQHGSQCVIGAQGRVVKPHGLTVEEMTVDPVSGVKISASPKSGKSRATQAQVLRATFTELRRELEELVQEKKDGRDEARREALYQGRELEGEEAKGREMEGKAWTVPGLELVPRGEIDEKLEPLLWLVEGDLDAWFYCRQPSDVALAVEIATDNGFLHRTNFVVSTRCWKAADELAATGRPVVLIGPLVVTERDYLTGEETEVFVPKIFADAGIDFALSSMNSTTESLWYQAALAIGHGLEREKALAAVTTQPAEILGLADRIGSIKPGADGDVVLFSGDPLSITSFVEHMILDGEHVYDRSEDTRAQYLLDGTEPPGPTAAAAEDAVEPEDNASDDVDEGESEDDDDDEEDDED